MSVGQYIKGEIQWMISVVFALIVINLILFTSTPLDQGVEEIFYMDVLSILILGTGIGLHYRIIKKTYESIEEAMTEEKDIRYILEQSPRVVGTTIMKRLIAYKDHHFMIKEEDYQQKMNDLKDFITQTVHDLKVNLSVCEMVVNRFEVKDERINKLIFQIEQMKFRINQVLWTTRANHYSEDIVSETVDISKVVRDGIRDNAEFFMSKGISLHLDVKPYHFVSDTKWVHYIITQILNNSSKYTEQSGEVKVFSEEDDKGYYIHIKDNGIGIVKEDISRIFEKGFTGKNGRRNTKSTGMGMYYAKKMADALGIGMTMHSEDGAYTETILAFYKISDYINQQKN